VTTDATPPAEARALVDRSAIIWLTTVSPTLQPQASPVWFVFDGTDFLVYSRGDAPRMRNLAAHPRVSLTLDDARTVVSIEAVARVIDGPPSDANREYQKKYRVAMMRMGYTPETFAAEYSVPIRISPTKWRWEDL
jgi:PPOX class probable F420-dependent enzyme